MNAERLQGLYHNAIPFELILSNGRRFVIADHNSLLIGKDMAYAIENEMPCRVPLKEIARIHFLNPEGA